MRLGSATARRIAALVSTLAWLGAVHPAGAQGAACFSPEDSGRLPFDVIVQAPPPRADNDRSWRYHPASGTASADLGALRASTANLKKYWYLWANRCHSGGQEQCGWNPKGNVVSPRLQAPSGEEVRTFFTSFAAANTCTLIQAAWALGSNHAEVDRMAAGARVRVVSREENPLQYMRGGRLVDICLLPETTLSPDAKGIVLDYEVQDARTPAQTEKFLLEFAALVKARGKQALLFTNPLDAPTQKYTGINTQNIAAIGQAFDAVGLTLWGKSKQRNVQASVSSQLQMVKQMRPDHIYLIFELSNTSMEDARFAREMMLRDHYAGVMLWRNYAEIGGSCDSEANRKIACLVFGRCR